MSLAVVICALQLANSQPVCTEEVDSVRAAMYVSAVNEQVPFNKGNRVGPLTLFLAQDKPKGAGKLNLINLLRGED